MPNKLNSLCYLDVNNAKACLPQIISELEWILNNMDVDRVQNEIKMHLPISKSSAINIRIADISEAIKLCKDNQELDKPTQAAYFSYLSNALKFLGFEARLNTFITRLKEAFFLPKWEDAITLMRLRADEISSLTQDWLDLHVFDENGFPICLHDPENKQMQIATRFNEIIKEITPIDLKAIDKDLTVQATLKRTLHNENVCNNVNQGNA